MRKIFKYLGVKINAFDYRMKFKNFNLYRACKSVIFYLFVLLLLIIYFYLYKYKNIIKHSYTYNLSEFFIECIDLSRVLFYNNNNKLPYSKAEEIFFIEYIIKTLDDEKFIIFLPRNN